MKRTMTVLEWALSGVALVLAIIMTVSLVLCSMVWRIAPFVGVGAMFWMLWEVLN